MVKLTPFKASRMEIWAFLDKNNYDVFCKQVGGVWVGALFKSGEFMRYGKEEYTTSAAAIYETEKIIYKHLKR